MSIYSRNQAAAHLALIAGLCSKIRNLSDIGDISTYFKVDRLYAQDLSNMDLSHVGFGSMHLHSCNFSNTTLYNVDMEYCSVMECNFYGSTLQGAYLPNDFKWWRNEGIIASTTRRNDWYDFYLIDGEVPMVKAGCRWMSIGQYMEHNDTNYRGTWTEKYDETLDILQFFSARVASREKEARLIA